MATSSDEMRKVAQQVWGALDKLADTNPEEYQKFINEQLKEGREMFVPPEPVFCLQCNVSSKRKNCRLYINVCKWTRVPRPKTDNDPIPVKGGTLRYLFEGGKKTQDLLIDIAFNPSVLDECTKDTTLEFMLMSLAFDFVESYAELRVDRKTCTKLKRPLFKGLEEDIRCSLDEQWRGSLSKESRLDIGDSLLKQLSKMTTEDSKDDSKLPPLKLSSAETQQKSAAKSAKLIEELASEAAASVDSTGLIVPEHSVRLKEADSRHPVRVGVKVTLPGVKSVGEVDLEISKDDLQLRVGRRYRLTLQFPAAVSEDHTKANFNPRTTVLSITIPCM